MTHTLAHTHCVPSACSACGGQKRALDSQESVLVMAEPFLRLPGWFFYSHALWRGTGSASELCLPPWEVDSHRNKQSLFLFGPRLPEADFSESAGCTTTHLRWFWLEYLCFLPLDSLKHETFFFLSENRPKSKFSDPSS